jgi:uncharacterized phage-like protein YoqJ
MIITFCGHSDFRDDEKYMNKMLEIIRENAKGENVTFYLGGYGGFDGFALACVKKYKEENPSAKLVFVTPYREEDFVSKRAHDYDEILFPDIDKTPHGVRIVKRNRYMMDKADLIIAYVVHKVGGAYNTLEYAKKKNKNIINLI